MSTALANTFDCLVLSGGGFKGAYGAGAAKALATYYELKGKRQVCYIGTSAGALNAAVLAADGADVLLQFWRTVNADDVLGTHTQSFLFQCAFGIIRDRCSKAPFSVYGNGNLTRLIRRAISLIRLKGKHLIIAATNFTTAHARAFFVSDLMEQFVVKDMESAMKDRRLDHCCPISSDDMLVRSLLASAAIPFFFPPVEIDGKWYVDGGVGNNTPTREAAYFFRFLHKYTQLLPGDVYCVKLAPARIVIENNALRGPMATLLRAYDVYDYIHMQTIIEDWFQINASVERHNAKLNEFVDWLEGQTGLEAAKVAEIVAKARATLGSLGGGTPRVNFPMIVIEPSASLGGTLDFSRAGIARNILLGYTDMLSALRQQNKIDSSEHEFLINRPL